MALPKSLFVSLKGFLLKFDSKNLCFDEWKPAACAENVFHCFVIRISDGLKSAGGSCFLVPESVESFHYDQVLKQRR